MAHARRVDLGKAQLLLIDIQERLLPHIYDHDLIVEQTLLMIRAAAEMKLPITVSEQYTQGLGPTLKVLKSAATQAGARAIEKMHFSVCGDETARERLSSLLRPHVIICGIEAHVCVQQTTLDLLDAQMQPVVLANAVGSRRPFDRDIALERMRAAGAVVTTVESAIFELTGKCGTPLFKRILPLVR